MEEKNSMQEYVGEIELSGRTIEGVVLSFERGTFPKLKFTDRIGYQNNKFNVVHGRFQGLGDVTIIDLLVTKSLGGIVQQAEAMAQSVVQGRYFEDELLFDGISFESHSLLKWIAHHSVKHTRDEGISIVSIPDQSDEIGTYEFEGFEVKIFVGPSFTRRIIEQEFDLKESCKVFIKAKSESSLESLLLVMNSLRKLLWIVTGVPIDVQCISAYHKTYKNSNGKYIAGKFLHNIRQEKEIRFPDLTFSFDEIKNDLEKLIKRWVEEKSLNSVQDLIHGNYVFGESNPDTLFLNMCYGLESFHRRIHPGKKFSDERFKEIKKIAQESILDSEIKNLVNEKLQFANEISLRNRLKTFEKHYSNISLKSFKDLLHSIVETRNSFVHSLDETDDIAKGLELIKLALIQQNILKALLFEHYGISEGLITDKLKVLGEEIEDIRKIM